VQLVAAPAVVEQGRMLDLHEEQADTVLQFQHLKINVFNFVPKSVKILTNLVVRVVEADL
jgi:hypothetical protein